MKKIKSELNKKMNSQDIIQGSRERFKQLSEGNFEKELITLIYDLVEDINSENYSLFEQRLKHFLQSTRSLHWLSFYNGWVESRVKLLKDEL